MASFPEVVLRVRLEQDFRLDADSVGSHLTMHRTTWLTDEWTTKTNPNPHHSLIAR